jgi:hypothetical protein
MLHGVNTVGFVVLKEQRMFEENVIAYLNISSSVLSDLDC